MKNTPTVEVHIITYNEEEILPYTLRHYQTFSDHIVIHDSFSTDRTRDIAKQAGCLVLDFDMGDVVNDQMMRELKQSCWKGSTANWVIVCDADELVYFPQGWQQTLQTYAVEGTPVVKPSGWQMVHNTFPTGPGQLYDEVKWGASDSYWYGKPCLFQPSLVMSVELSAGAHTGVFRLKNGHVMPIEHRTTLPNRPPTWLLHCKHLGPLSRVAKRYDDYRSRLSDLNKRMGWGNLKDGLTHATETREQFINRLERIIP